MRRKVVKMKSRAKSKSIIMILITLGVIFALLPIITNNHTDGIVFDNEILKTSEVSGKISINGNSGWASFKAAGNCTGDGTYSLPYVIEDLIIDGGGSGSCILIENSDAYFIVRNCSLYNSGSPFEAGIKLDNADNGKIINNNCSDNIFFGIYLDYSDNNTVSGNTANDNKESGIILYDYSDNNIISGNTANNNTYGIALSNSDNNTLLGNNANNNSYGIYLQGSNNSTLSGNNASNNHGGIYLSGSYNNTLSGNNANNNNFGIYISVSNNNTLSGNNASNNNDCGMYLGYSSNNTKIFLNHFINNGINAVDFGINNTWDDGFTGNYYDDYGGVDANDDGIGDSPYDVHPTGGSMDNYPIWWDPPVFSVNLPSQNDYFSINSPNFDISIEEGVVNLTWYTLDGGIVNKTFTGLTGTIDQALWDSTSDGSVTITFYANDTMNEMAFKEISIYKDATTPIITINSPSVDEIFGNNAPGFNLTIIEANIHTIWYTLDSGSTNITFTGLTGTISQTIWDSVSEGDVTIRFYVNDSAGNLSYEQVQVVKRISEEGWIPGYNLFFLLGILSVVAIIISTKLKKFNK